MRQTTRPDARQGEPRLRGAASRPYEGLIARYRSSLPVRPATPVVTLLEGATPLLGAPRLARRAGLPEDSLYLKLEGLNPTGSFKDRGMTLAVSKALEEGARGVLCASTGNTAASAAAYAARAGLPCLVLLPAGSVAAGKLAQSLAHGARAAAVRGNFDEALSLAVQASRDEGWTLVNSLNPYRIEGQKTAAFEIAEDLGRPPDFQFLPVGNAGNITAYWKGYREWAAARGGRLPRLIGLQAAGAAPIVLGRPVERPETFATAIRIGRPASWASAVAARDESGGRIEAVSDREILEAYGLLAREEGVFCEPASAAAVAGLLRLGPALWRGLSAPAKRRLRVVCVLTGHGLKDPDAPARLGARLTECAASPKAVARLLRGPR